ncbi:MAG TPA: class I SAM-dependent methyltransferase [Phycisphaerae bacterium]|nr:class I SAM-dependent methyltransferase [Phycisphaerae bacterium]
MECWICGSADVKLYRESGVGRLLKPEDMRITDSRYGLTVRLNRCSSCGFVFGDAAEIQAIESLYTALEDPDYETGAAERTLQMSKLLDLVKKLRPNAETLLDIGAGIGLLVDEASRRSLKAEGIEPSTWAVSVGRRRGAKLHEGFFPHPATNERRFDVITIVDVIEHVSNPLQLLRAVREHLTPRGISIIVTPDISSIAARCLGRRWWHFRLAHVGYFNDKSIKQAFREAGLAVVARKRAKWYFKTGYLAERLGVYFPPLRFLSRRLEGTSLYRRVVPLNLFDSWVYAVTNAPTSQPY